MASASTFTTYQDLLDAYCADAMTVVRRVAAELDAARTGAPSPMSFDDVVRTTAWITSLVCRAIAVSAHLADRPAPAEETADRLHPALESVLSVYAANPLDRRDYVRAVDAELVRGAELAETTVGGPPAAMLIELCRDFGMVMRAVPSAWLAPVTPALRHLCDRAATAAIRPETHSTSPGHLMER